MKNVKVFCGEWKTRHHRRFKILKIETPGHLLYFAKKGNEEDYLKFFEETDKVKTVRVGMSGCEDRVAKHERYHITMSGYVGGGREDLWVFEKDEIRRDLIDWKEIDGNVTILHCLVAKFPFKLVPVVLEDGLEIFEDLRILLTPVVKIYESNRSFSLFHRDISVAYVEFIKNSFEAVVEFGREKVFRLPKVGGERIGSYVYTDYSSCFYGLDYTQYEYGSWDIFVNYFKGRKVLYIKRGDWNYVYGWEIYESIFHPRCMIDVSSISMSSLLISRLGDVLFLPADEIDKEKTFETGEEFEELKKEDGRLKKVDITEIGNYLILFHPEHGYLEIKRGFRYRIENVPYLVRGHD